MARPPQYLPSREVLSAVVRELRKQKGLTREKAAELAADMPFPTFRDLEITDSNVQWKVISALLEIIPDLFHRLAAEYDKRRSRGSV